MEQSWGVQNNFLFVFWIKLNGKMHSRKTPNVSPTVKGIPCIGPEQNYSEIPLQTMYSIDVRFSDTLRRHSSADL